MYKISKPVDNCILFEFEKQKDLSLSFCRVQEFYESDKPELKGKHFTFEELVKTLMDDIGNIDYFSYWEGFNVPGKVWKAWSQNITDFSIHELRLDTEIISNYGYSDNYYVIGALVNDKVTIDHEIAHALYYTNTEYRNEINVLISEFLVKQEEQYKKLENVLSEMGYAESVLQDEIHAYLATSKKRELIEDFGLDYEKIQLFVKKMKKVLRKYNKT